MAQLTDYTGLITSKHADKPKFTATVSLVAQAFIDAITAAQGLPQAFDLDTAIGVQLDAVGLWAGIGRSMRVPLAGVYFSFDSAGLGFDQGSWIGNYAPTQGLSPLDDDTYRMLIRAKIAANHWDGTLASAQGILQGIFPDGQTQIFLLDNQDMSMTVGLVGAIPSAAFLAILTEGYLPLKPEGVSASYVIPSQAETPIFGFDVETQYISGFDAGSYAVSPSTPQLVAAYLDSTFILNQSQLL